VSRSLLSPAQLRPPRPVDRRTGSAALAAALAVAEHRWRSRVEYRAASRWSALLPADAAADVLDPSLHEDLARAQVWLLSWLPGQGTGLHDHGGSAGAFAVVRGTLHERVGARAGAAGLSAGRVRHFGPHHVHQVTNRGAEPVVSVHVYTPGLSVMNTYRVDGRVLVRTGTERAGVDW
jgi:mannose-6-phosphate isomerase-like protein (cupin superfamily)